MGNKLSFGEGLESMSAVLAYLEDNGTLTLPKNVSVIKNGKLIVNDEIDVLALKFNSYMRVDIFWEKSGYEDYKDLGLYGLYGSSYCRMTYVDRILKINSDDNIEIVIR